MITVKPDLTFLQLDLLSPQFVEELHAFDTVTAIHIMEHLPEEQLPLAFEHLLQVTRCRLIIAVPYEAESTRAYGHEQVFTREKLEHWDSGVSHRLAALHAIGVKRWLVDCSL